MSLFSTVLAVTSTGSAISPLAAMMMPRRVRRASVLTVAAASVTGLAGAGVLTGVVIPEFRQSQVLTTIVGLLLATAVAVGAVWLLRSAVTFFARPRPAAAAVSAPAARPTSYEVDGAGYERDGGQWR